MSQSPDFVEMILKKYWQPGKKIVDIGCGPGFLKKVFQEDYIGIDYTDENYTQALERKLELVSQAGEIGLKSNTADIVMVKSAFHLFPNPTKALEEAFRLLKQNGQLVIFDYNKRTLKDLAKRMGVTNLPSWSQWELKNLVKNAGFMNTQLLLPRIQQPHFLTKPIYHILQELLGTWAIITARKNTND